jgi:hypothetical protein
VSTDRVRGQLEPLRDLLPAGPLHQQEQDVPLTPRERSEQVIAIAAVVLILDEQAQHCAQICGRYPGVATDNAADDAKKIIDRLGFPHPRRRSGAYRGHNPLGLGRRAEHGDTRLGAPPRQVQAEGGCRVIRQLGVEQNDIGRPPNQDAGGELRGLGFRHDR